MSKRPRKAKEPGYIVPALERGLLLLQAFSKDKPVQSLGVLAKDLGLPRATTFRLANTLEHLGFLIRDQESGEYRIGAAALKLGWTYLSGLELPEIAQPFLADLRYRTGASVHMAVRDGHEIVYVNRLATNTALSSNIRVGSRLPAHASSMGRAMLQDLEDDDLLYLYRGIRELAPFSSETPHTVMQLRDLLLKDAENDGIIISKGYYEKGVVSIAAPVRDGRDVVVAAINITAAAGRYTDEVFEGDIRNQVLRSAGQISMALGHDPESHTTKPGMGLALAHTALAEPRYHGEDEQGHPKYQDREGLEKADREYRKDERRLVREHKAHEAEMLRRYAAEDEEETF
ncbi:MAG: IclR family transcriptional regulator [Rhodospirillaceae bacterium]|nr:IclR family transcriptional regulator [Rhodospirillaceae bacterium]